MSGHHISRKALTIDVVIAICLAGSALAQRTVYVDGSVGTTGDGSQAAPFQTIAEALALTEVDLTIRVAGGTYATERPNTRILSGQTLIGSYDSSFTTSDPSATPTIIDMASLSAQEQNRTFRCQAVAPFTIANLVIKNSSTGESGNTTNGGAIYVQNGSQGTIRGVTFVNCTSKFENGAETGPARDGGALCIRDGSTVVVEDCVFDGCTAVGSGGAITMRNAGGGNNVKIHRCLFTRCGSRNGASAIHDQDAVSQIEIVNCLFVDNGVDVAVPSGVAPSNYEIRVTDKRALIYNCTFLGSNNPDGFMFDLRNSSDAAAVKAIVNCIIANNTIASGGSTFALFGYAGDYDDATTLQHNLFFSNAGLEPLDPAGASIIGANGNITGEPQFADAAHGDYHLQAASPGVDAGQALALVPDDFAGTARPVGSAYDIGALEGQAVLNPVFYQVPNVMATASSSLNADSGPGKTVDGSGLNAADQHDVRVANMWSSAAGQQPPVWIQYELQGVYKLDQMWVWNANSELEWLLGWGVKTATIEYSTDGATWTALANVPPFAQAPGTADYIHNTTVDFGGVAARFVRMTCTSSWGGGGQYGLSEVRFFYLPVAARDPHPSIGAKGVPLDTTLSWTAGREAASHQVYLGTDPNALMLVGTVVTPGYTPAGLILGSQYWWRIDEINTAEAVSTWAGPVWTFTTADYLVVDDFESYNDEQDTGTRIYETWADGWNEPQQNGSQVGYTDPPFAERTTIHGGRQAMPLLYDNSTALVSETTRTFADAQDWTEGGVKTLTLYFYGDPNNAPGQLYVKINGTKIAYPGAAGNTQQGRWNQWNVDLAAVATATVKSVRTLTIGVGNGTGTGRLFIDDIRLYRSAPAVSP
jgi:hypothetical protein